MFSIGAFFVCEFFHSASFQDKKAIWELIIVHEAIGHICERFFDE